MLVRAWPAGRPRILVTDAWLANAGDGAIALATQERLRRAAPDAAILHAAYQGDLLATAYPELDLVPPLSGLTGVTPGIPEMAGWDAKEAEQLLAEADVVFSQGGGYAMEHYGPRERLYAWQVVVDRGLPIGFGAQTVGPFGNEQMRRILGRVYRAATVIALREPESVRHALQAGAPADRLIVTADEAFSLDSAPDRPPHARRGIACVLSRDPQLRGDGTLAAPDRTAATLARVVSTLADHAVGEPVTLLSSCQGLGHLERGVEDDAAVIREVIAALPDAVAARVRTLPGYLAPRALAAIIAEHRALVSTRMHPAIFAVTAGVPAVLLSSAYKATDTFAMLRLEGVVAEGDDPAEALERRLAAGPLSAPSTEVARERASWNNLVVDRLLAGVAVV